MTKVVLDTNVLISAIVFGGKPREVLLKIIKGRIGIVISKDILDELEGVLSGKKFQYPQQIVNTIRTSVEDLSEFITPKKRLAIIKDDPQDNRIIECALEGKADFIISGDHHLLELKQYQDIKILTPSDFLKDFETK